MNTKTTTKETSLFDKPKKEYEKLSTVAVDKFTAEKLQTFCKNNDMNKKEFVSLSLAFFEKYGINPRDYESPSEEMKRIVKRLDSVISFFKHDEKHILFPLQQETKRTTMALIKQMIEFQTEIIDSRKEREILKERTEGIRLSIGNLSKGLDIQQSKTDKINDTLQKLIEYVNNTNELFYSELKKQDEKGALGKLFGSKK